MGGVLVDLSTVYQRFSWRRRSFPFLLLSRRSGRVSSGGSFCRGELTAKSRLLLKKLFFLCCFCETAGFNRKQVDLGLLTQLVLLSILLHNFPLLFPLFIEHLFPLHPRPPAGGGFPLSGPFIAEVPRAAACFAEPSARPFAPLICEGGSAPPPVARCGVGGRGHLSGKSRPIPWLAQGLRLLFHTRSQISLQSAWDMTQSHDPSMKVLL